MQKLIDYLKTRGLKESDYSYTRAGNLNFAIDGRQFQFSKTGYFRAKADRSKPRGAWKVRPFRNSPWSRHSLCGYQWYLVFKVTENGWGRCPTFTEDTLIERLKHYNF